MKKVLLSIATVIGALVILAALYLIVVKAGNPVQDRMSYMKTGEVMLLAGSVFEFALIILGTVLKLKKK